MFLAFGNARSLSLRQRQSVGALMSSATRSFGPEIMILLGYVACATCGYSVGAAKLAPAIVGGLRLGMCDFITIVDRNRARTSGREKWGSRPQFIVGRPHRSAE